MSSLFVFTIIVLACGASVYLRKATKQKKRAAALRHPLPEAWKEILLKNIPMYDKLPQPLQSQLHDCIKIFLLEKNFEGCNGLIITDEIRVTVAGEACLLLLNRETGCYPRLRTILMYPSTYVAGGKGLLGNSPNAPSARLGESWNSGAVVLAWDSVKSGARNVMDGHNVAIHEFAHQLDQEDGSADGAPTLGHRSAYTAWARIFSEEFEHHVARTDRGRKDVIDAYGATNPAEFFAVASESFFEKPRQLQKKHPELYEELQRFYRVNPIEWH